MREEIIEELDAEIARLTEARNVILGAKSHSRDGMRRGLRRRPMSPATKAKIAERQRERWAQQRAAKKK